MNILIRIFLVLILLPHSLNPSLSPRPVLSSATLAPLTQANKKPQSILTQGQVVANDRYQLIGKLGQGANGEVWRALMKGTSRSVVVKFMLQKDGNKENVERFISEARVLAGLSHPNVIRVYEVNSFLNKEGQKVWYIVMEDVRGVSFESKLREYIQNRNEESKKELVEVVVKVLKALKYVHGQGVLHRDLKPANLLITKEGEPMLIDFGSAQSSGSNSSQGSSAVEFSPYFMAPETLFDPGKIDERTDYYSIGAILYFIFVGRLPYKYASNVNALLNELSSDISVTSSDYGDKELVDSLSIKEKNLLRKSMAFDIQGRYSNIDLFIDDLKAYTFTAKKTTRRLLGSLSKLLSWNNGADQKKVQSQNKIFQAAKEKYTEAEPRGKEDALRVFLIELDSLDKEGFQGPGFFITLGNVCHKLGILKWVKGEKESAKIDFQKAEFIYRRSILNYPENNEGYIALAGLYKQIDLSYQYYKDFLHGRIRFVRFGEAEGLYTRVLQHNGRHETAYYERAALKYECIKSGVLDASNYALVQRDLEKCLELNPVDSTTTIKDREEVLRVVYFLAKAYYRDKKYDLSIQWLNQGIEDLNVVIPSITERIKNPKYRSRKSEWIRRQQRFRSLLESANSLAGDIRKIYVDQAIEFLKWPNYVEAEEILTETLKMFPNSQTLHIWRIQAKLRQITSVSKNRILENEALNQLNVIFSYYQKYLKADVKTKSYPMLKIIVEREILIGIGVMMRSRDSKWADQASRIVRRHLFKYYDEARLDSKRRFNTVINSQSSFKISSEISAYFDVPWSFFKERSELHHLFNRHVSHSRPVSARYPLSSRRRKPEVIRGTSFRGKRFFEHSL